MINLLDVILFSTQLCLILKEEKPQLMQKKCWNRCPKRYLTLRRHSANAYLPHLAPFSQTPSILLYVSDSPSQHFCLFNCKLLFFLASLFIPQQRHQLLHSELLLIYPFIMVGHQQNARMTPTKARVTPTKDPCDTNERPGCHQQNAK